MLTFDALREIILALPDTVETTSWDRPVFKVPLDERDLLLEADPETVFSTEHHRPWPLALARPDKVDPGWVRANVTRVWRAQVKKRTLKAWDAARGAL